MTLERMIADASNVPRRRSRTGAATGYFVRS
jgi:hypothetical protein